MVQNDLKSRKKLNIFFAVCMTLLYCLFCFALIPLWKMFANDVQYMDTVLPTIIEFIYDLVELIAIALAYATVLYSIYTYGLGKTWISVAIFSLVTLFKHIANLCMTWTDAGFDADNLWSDIRSIIIPLFLEVLQYLIVILIANRILSAYLEYAEKRDRAAEKLGADKRTEGLYPFKNLFHFKNPMIRCALWAGVVVAASKVAQRVVYDVFYSLMYGLPEMEEIPVMIIYYLSDIFVGAACYLFVVWTVMLFFEKKIKRELYENN